MECQGRVLIVDDEQLNRELLGDLLESQGYSVSCATDGHAGLELARSERPEVVLLDVMMPGLDGYEVCRRLKAAPETAPLPVILVTALSDRDSRLRGIEAGANDFLTKPIDLHDTALRVRNAVRVYRLYQLLESRNQELNELVRLREGLTDMLIHDLKSPLTSILGFLKIVAATAAPRLEPKELDFLQRSARAGARMLEMITSLLDVSRLEEGQLPVKISPCDLAELVGSVVGASQSLVGQRTLEWHSPEQPVMVRCDPELTCRVLTNLLDNATKYARTRIALRVVPQGPAVRVEVVDDGVGIPESHHERVFEKFGQVAGGSRYSTGLGLTFCRLAVRAQEGEIGLHSREGEGSTFWFTLPAQ